MVLSLCFRNFPRLQECFLYVKQFHAAGCTPRGRPRLGHRARRLRSRTFTTRLPTPCSSSASGCAQTSTVLQHRTFGFRHGIAFGSNVVFGKVFCITSLGLSSTTSADPGREVSKASRLVVGRTWRDRSFEGPGTG